MRCGRANCAPTRRAAAVERAVAAAPGWSASSTSRASSTSTPGFAPTAATSARGCTALPRPVSHRGDHAAGRQRRHSRRDLRRLRRLRRGLPDGRRHLCPAAAGDPLARLRALLLGYAEAGGSDPVVLLHDAAQGEPLIDALARHGDGLPARVLPLRLNEVSQADLAILAAAFAWGAAGGAGAAAGPAAARRRGCSATSDYAGAALDGPRPRRRCRARRRSRPTIPSPGRGAGAGDGAGPAAPRRNSCPRHAAGGAAAGAARAAWGPPAPRCGRDARRAPFGAAGSAAAGCTLCLACAMVCPTGAFSATRRGRSCASSRTPACNAASAPRPARRR